MNVTKPISPSTSALAENPLDRVTLTSFERLRAEAALRRGEYLAELLMEAVAAMRSLYGNVKLKAPVDAAHRLDPAA